jgi:hypothetical protein
LFQFAVRQWCDFGHVFSRDFPENKNPAAIIWQQGLRNRFGSSLQPDCHSAKQQSLSLQQAV